MMWFCMKLLTLMRYWVGVGSLPPKPEKTSLENRHHHHQEENGDADGHDGHRHRIHQGRLDLLAQAGGVFQVGGQTGEDFRQQSALFPGAHHGIIEPVENLGMFLQGLGKTVAPFHPRRDVLDDVAHHLVVRLVGQGLEGLDHGQAGVNHGGQLPGENDQIGQGDLAAAGAALFAEFFVDGNDQHIAIQQGGDRAGLAGGLNRTADFPAGHRIAGDIAE